MPVTQFGVVYQEGLHSDGGRKCRLVQLGEKEWCETYRHHNLPPTMEMVLVEDHISHLCHGDPVIVRKNPFACFNEDALEAYDFVECLGEY